ncbi:hypothetical protein G7Y89_g8793 [Cudoniella acicularis]|uniref:Uncharacterized protein n=1 Tax=Cudoniella acicularis TaxID=354080 RepID=A0A8H4W2J7_9HELO|nr:hypothetical protein G7Y89_g8793 [Cudoniella acicularis]
MTDTPHSRISWDDYFQPRATHLLESEQRAQITLDERIFQESINIVSELSPVSNETDSYYGSEREIGNVARGSIDITEELLPVTSLLKAYKNQHYQVVASVAGFVLLRVATLVSTSLLVVVPTNISSSVPIIISTKVDGTNFWKTIPTSAALFPDGQTFLYTNVSSEPVISYAGILAGQAQAAGSKGNTAFQLFDVSLRNENVTSITAIADAFVPNMTFFCGFDYTITKANLTHIIRDNLYDLSLPPSAVTGRYLNNLTALQFLVLVESTLAQAAGMNGQASGLSDQLTSDDQGPLFSLMDKYWQNISNDNLTGYEEFFNATKMGEAASQIISGMVTQIIRQSFLLPDNYTALGTSVYVEDRLHLQYFSLWVTAAELMSLSALSFFLLLTTNPHVVSQIPVTPTSHATILASSPSLQMILRGSVDSRNSDLRSRLRAVEFQTESVRYKYFRIKVHGSVVEDLNDRRSNQRKRDRVPYSGRRHAFKASDRDEGVVNVSSDTSAASYAIRYSSTLAILLIATLFNALDFAVTSLTAYSVLRKGPPSASARLGPGGNLSYLLDEYPFLNKNGLEWFGWIDDLHMGPWNVRDGTYYIDLDEVFTDEEPYQREIPDNPDGCPSLAAVFGLQGPKSTPPDNMAVLVCYQQIQQVDTQLTFVGLPQGGFQLSPNSPPI